jgi:hypothetical protein
MKMEWEAEILKSGKNKGVIKWFDTEENANFYGMKIVV